MFVKHGGENETQLQNAETEIQVIFFQHIFTELLLGIDIHHHIKLHFTHQNKQFILVVLVK